MLKKTIVLALVCLGLLIPTAKANDFVILDQVTFVGPFTIEGVVSPEFASPAAVHSMELLVTYHAVTPDGCCAATNYDLYVSLEGKSSSGDWYTLLRETIGISGTSDPIFRIIMVGQKLAFLSGTNLVTGEKPTSTLISYGYGEIPHALRVRFSLDNYPGIPPRPDDLKRFTVSASGRMFN